MFFKNKKIKSANSTSLNGTNNGEDIDVLLSEASRAPIETIIRKLMKNKFFIIGAIGFLAVVFLCFIGSVFIPLNTTYTELTHANLMPSLNYLNVPSEVKGEDIKKISSGISFTAAITNDGKFYIWGSEANKEQANVSTYIFDVPIEMQDKKIIDIACGGNHIIAVDEDYNFYSWGYNGNGQTNIPQNIKMAFLNGDTSIAKMLATSQWSAVLSSDNKLYIWGSIQAQTLLLIPTDIQGRIIDFAAGDNNIALLLDDGTVRVVGEKGSEFNLNLPESLTDTTVNIIDIAATNRNVLALDDEGNLYSWGSLQDNLGEVPIINSEVVSINSGYRNFLALSKDGSVTIWGSDDFNQLNLSNDIKDIEKIYADYFQFYAISKTGDIAAFGNEGYIFGTDQYGRDIFTRIIHGGKTSLTVGAVAVIISVIIALFVGLSAGYFGGIVDSVLMRITDVFSSIPFFPIAITLSYVVGFSLNQVQKMYMIMIILGLLSWMSLARLIRAQLLLEREKDFVLAARALGLKNSRIMWQHILPNIFNLIIVNITLGYASSLLSEAALSFLGFGVSEPLPSWGNMLMSAQEMAVIEFYWWRWLIPAGFVIITAVSVNLMGDALREALDPRTGE